MAHEVKNGDRVQHKNTKTELSFPKRHHATNFEHLATVLTHERKPGPYSRTLLAKVPPKVLHEH
jgi:hypothetical protein